MTYRFLTDLDQALRARGISFQEYGDWRNCGRPESTGGFDPQGVLCHHTASPAGTSDENEIAAIMAGNSSAPGPISQLFIGRSGDVYILAAGRANHGGKGKRPGVDTGGCADMNALLLGIEGGNSGVGEYWDDTQTEVYGQVVHALCDWYGWSIDTDVYLHATTGPPNGGCNSKIDPAGPWQAQVDLTTQTWDLDVWRAWCKTMGGQSPTPTPPGDGDMAYVIYESKDEGGNRWAWADFLGLEAGGLCESVVWIDGNYKAQIEQSGAAVEHKSRAQGGYNTFRLEGTDFDQMNAEDQQYDWKRSDFRKVT